MTGSEPKFPPFDSPLARRLRTNGVEEGPFGLGRPARAVSKPGDIRPRHCERPRGRAAIQSDRR